MLGQGIPRERAPRLIDEAWDLAITTFHTADAYGGERSEALIVTPTVLDLDYAAAGTGVTLVLGEPGPVRRGGGLGGPTMRKRPGIGRNSLDQIALSSAYPTWPL